jgi:hypothetical protein
MVWLVENNKKTVAENLFPGNLINKNKMGMALSNNAKSAFFNQ